MIPAIVSIVVKCTNPKCNRDHQVSLICDMKEIEETGKDGEVILSMAIDITSNKVRSFICFHMSQIRKMNIDLPTIQTAIHNFNAKNKSLDLFSFNRN